MKLSTTIQITSTAVVLALTMNIAHAAKGGGGGGKGPGNGGGGGGSGFDTPVEYPLAIFFRDQEGDGIQGDGGIYYDGDLALEGEDPLLDAHIDASSGGNYGNLYLRTTDTFDRSLWVDITDCDTNCENPPFEAEYIRNAGFTVVATDAVSRGFCGMAVDQPISVPMELTYWLPGADHPGFVLYEPDFKGKSPCRGKNGSSEVSVIRTGTDTWTVSGSLACVAGPDQVWGGLVNMPFEFYVTNMSEEDCQ